ncbi:MAG: Orn/Lys/Arg decarboxylase N-terminal domain-containing protein [Acidimicrobiales bacterium]|jgi:arginine decarboxylase
MTGQGVLDRAAFPILIVAGPERERLAGETLRRIVAELGDLGHYIVRASSITDAAALVASDPSFGCLLLDWNLDQVGDRHPAEAVLDQARRHNVRMPVFLMVEREDLEDVPLAVEEIVQEYVLVLEDTPSFVAGRIDYAWRRHTENLLPPFFKTLVAFTESHEYSWHTPGHAGGTAFRKSQVGKAFYDFYGETLFRTDLSVSVAELGSLLDHSGVVAQAEKNAARVFGADTTYFVLNGTSTSNQIVAHACVVAGDLVLADRNCHKSVNYALTVTDAIPVYLMPSRNGYGIIGPIPPARLSPQAVAAAVAANPLAQGTASKAPVYAVVTNSTYDGLCYRADRVVELLGQSVPRLHFDEAWFAYARFHPLYVNRYAMYDRTPAAGDPTLFATQSTHKLLAAFSQGSMIHIRPSDRAPVEPSRFNEAYMMHGSTSPFYPMIACLDVASAMMDGPGGLALVQGAIREAVRFRKRIVTLGRELAKSPDGVAPWFFGVWQPEEVHDPLSNVVSPFADTPDDLLETEPSCWSLEPRQPWHGFAELDSDYCMLDPTKVTLTTPGVDAAGHLAETGIPAPIVASYLDSHRVEVEKTGDYSLLFLFSIGTTRGKWGTLLEGLLGFKRAYDSGQSVAAAIPDLAAAYPDRYGKTTLRELCDEMHSEVRARGTIELLDRAFAELPLPATTPSHAYRGLVRARTERVPVSEMAGRVSAVMVVPYPPGIPILMPGERAGALDGPVLRYLLALEAFDAQFPGFAHDIHGVERDDLGMFSIECLSDGVADPSRVTGDNR